MSAPKWTPGPWRIDPRAETHVVGPDDRGICSTGGHQSNLSEGHYEENAANAHLIAAAPALAEAAEDATAGPYNLGQLADHLENSGFGDGAVARVREIAESLGTAAALARGEAVAS